MNDNRFRKRRSRFAARKPNWLCEPLESRTLFSVLNIAGTTGADTITLSISTPVINLTRTPFIDWTINGGTKHTQAAAGVTAINIDGVANSSTTLFDTVNVSQSWAIPVTVIGHSVGNSFFPNPDVLNVGNATKGMQDVQGSLNITRGSEGGSWKVSLDDSGNSVAARTGILNSGLSGVAPGNVTWASTAVAGLTVSMGSFGGSSLSVLDPAGATVSVVGNSTGADDTLNLGNNHVTSSIGNLSISVAAGAPRGLWNVAMDDGAGPPAGTLGFIAGADTGLISWLTGSHSSPVIGGTYPNYVSWAPGSISNFNLITPPQVTLSMGSMDVPMTVVTKSNNAVSMGNTTNGLQSITAPVTVTGAGRLQMDDANDTTSRSVLMSRVGTAVAIDGLAPATITYDLPSVVAGSSNVQMNLWNTFDGGTVTVLAAGQVAGNLTSIYSNRPVAFTVGTATTVPDIRGTLAIYCNGSNLKNTVHVNDSLDTVARSIAVGATILNSVAMGTIRGLPGGAEVDYAATQTAGPVIIDGGSGGNSFSVNTADTTSGANAASVALTLNLGAGADLATIKTNAVAVNGQAGNDVVTVEYSTVVLPGGGGTFSPSTVTFDGGADIDKLSIIGKLATQAFGVTAAAVTQSAQTTSFSNLESLALTTGAFAIAADLNGLNLTVAGSGSTANFTTTQHLGTFTVDGSAVATIASSPSPGGKTLFATALAITNGAALNITNNIVQINYTADPIATIQTYLKTGYNSGAWNGVPNSTSGAIRSSTAAATPLQFSVGYADSADVANPAALPANTIKLRYTAIGDTNLDGSVGLTDLTTLLQNYNTGTKWDQGDLTYDGTVGLTDLTTLLQHYNATAGAPSPAATPGAAVATPVDLSAPASTKKAKTLVPMVATKTVVPARPVKLAKKPK